VGRQRGIVSFFSPLENTMEPGNNVRVLLVDDHVIVRQTLRGLLQAYPNIEVVGEASDGAEPIACVGRLQPAVVVMDMNTKKLDGITAARLIKRQYPHVLVLGFSADLKEYNVYTMQQAGAFEVLQQEDALKDLYAAIQRAVAAIQSNTETKSNLQQPG
jgi:DNA-binding NarL/FixJ family response regulator